MNNFVERMMNETVFESVDGKWTIVAENLFFEDDFDVLKSLNENELTELTQRIGMVNQSAVCEILPSYYKKEF